MVLPAGRSRHCKTTLASEIRKTSFMWVQDQQVLPSLASENGQADVMALKQPEAPGEMILDKRVETRVC